MSENYAKVQQGFRILQPVLAGYIGQEMSREYKENWWQELLTTLGDKARDLPLSGDYAELTDSLDIANCLRLLDWKWNELFRRKLSIDYRTWSKELMGVRNKLAHLGGQDFNDSDTWRALDTMARLCGAMDDSEAEEIRKILRETRYGSAAGSTTVTNSTPAAEKPKAKHAAVLSHTASGLPSWREVIEPHPDVAQGRYKNAEFAADLAQVARGEGAFEYRDPVEFFARTYVTEGMTGLLVQATKRLKGKDGEPVIQLKTAFGGGKTHSMLALYHMMRGKVSIDQIPNVRPVLERAGVDALPKANVAVLVGTALDPTKSKRPINFPGITINTLWGEMAAQLAESAGRAELYDYVKEADKKGVSPGSEALKKLFDDCGPCLILMDELVAYAKKIYGVSGLPAGSFDNFISFIQEVTEAARASKTVWWWRPSLNRISRSAGKRAKLHWKPSSTPLAEWNPSGSRWQPTRVLKSCGAGFSWIAKILMQGIRSVHGSARCIWKMQGIFHTKRRKWSIGNGCCPAIPFIRKFSIAYTKIGLLWNGSSVPEGFCG